MQSAAHSLPEAAVPGAGRGLHRWISSFRSLGLSAVQLSIGRCCPLDADFDRSCMRISQGSRFSPSTHEFTVPLPCISRRTPLAALPKADDAVIPDAISQAINVCETSAGWRPLSHRLGPLQAFWRGEGDDRDAHPDRG